MTRCVHFESTRKNTQLVLAQITHARARTRAKRVQTHTNTRHCVVLCSTTCHCGTDEVLGTSIACSVIFVATQKKQMRRNEAPTIQTCTVCSIKTSWAAHGKSKSPSCLSAWVWALDAIPPPGTNARLSVVSNSSLTMRELQSIAV